MTMNLFDGILKITKKWTKKIYNKIKSIFLNIDGYLEDQVFYIAIYFAVQYLIYKFLLDIIFGYDIINDIIISRTPQIFNNLFYIYVAAACIYKAVLTIKKYGIHSFLIVDFIMGFKIKYFSVYLECLIIQVFLLVAFMFLKNDNSDILGLFPVIIIVQRISTSIMKNYLGKVLLNRKIEALNEGKKIDVSIKESTFSESIYLIDHLYESMKTSLDVKYKSERLKTDLITNISHDIKTPLTSIINYVDIVKNTDDEVERKKYIDILEYNAKRLKSMVVDLIDASKTGTGNIDLNYEIIELNELILQVYGQFDTRFEDKNLEFVYNSFSDNIFINVDGDQLSRVFENILGNATNYSKENSKITMTVSVIDSQLTIITSNETREKLEVKAEDLLEQFVRGEKSRTSEGSGLGLYISRNLIELMKGKLKIETEDYKFSVIISFKIKTNKKKIN